MRTVNDKILDETNVTADTRGKEVVLEFIFGYSIQVNWTATTGAAAVKIEATNDGENWIELVAPNQAILNNSGSSIFPVVDGYYRSIRIFLDWTSGTIDSVNVILNGKGV